ncbi:MAG TPA: START domain-containing protein [Polyangiales bacterium]|nr:START domain-containing protein [Polyangiales bacterium]
MGAASAQDEAGWRKLSEEHGITVSTREQPGRQLPSFRGQADVKAPLLQVLAVVLDDARSNEWVNDADEAAVLRRIDAHTQIVYSRSHQTWPIRDRDLVMKRTVSREGDGYRVRLVCMAGEKPKVDGVIRIGDCETEFVLRPVDAETTHVDYRVRADPGGSNPEWAVKWASKNIPLDTLTGLRKQVAKTRGKYDLAKLASNV